MNHAVVVGEGNPLRLVTRIDDKGSMVGSLEDSFTPTDIETRAYICELEASLEAIRPAGEDENVRICDDELTLVHHFAPSTYGREIFIPKDTVVIGKLHRHSHLNVIAKGHVKIVTEAGEEELIAPAIWTSRAGIKRAVYALEDTIWMTIHPTDTTDLDAIEEVVIADKFSDIGLEDIKLEGKALEE